MLFTVFHDWELNFRNWKPIIPPLLRTHHCPLRYVIVLTRQCVITSMVFKFRALSLVTEWGSFSLVNKNLSMDNCQLCFWDRKVVSWSVWVLRELILGWAASVWQSCSVEWHCGIAGASLMSCFCLKFECLWFLFLCLDNKRIFFRMIISGVLVSGIVSTSVCWYCMNKWNVTWMVYLFTLCGIRTRNQEPPVPIQGC
jgi:hypothetical protein